MIEVGHEQYYYYYFKIESNDKSLNSKDDSEQIWYSIIKKKK